MSNDLDQARAKQAAAQQELTEANAELALAICGEIKRVAEEVKNTLSPLQALIKEMPLRQSLDNSDRRRRANQLTVAIEEHLAELKTLATAVQTGWQEDAK